MDRMAKQFPTQALAIQAELTTDQNLVDIKLAVIEKFSRLDILINCAGKPFFFLFIFQLFVQVLFSLGTWQRHFLKTTIT